MKEFAFWLVFQAALNLVNPTVRPWEWRWAVATIGVIVARNLLLPTASRGTDG